MLRRVARKTMPLVQGSGGRCIMGRAGAAGDIKCRGVSLGVG